MSISFKRNGAMRFLTLGRLKLTWCWSKGDSKRTQQRKARAAKKLASEAA